MISTADPNMQGGDYLNLGFGLMYQLPDHLGKLNGEYALPVYQNVQGVHSPRRAPWPSATICRSSGREKRGLSARWKFSQALPTHWQHDFPLFVAAGPTVDPRANNIQLLTGEIVNVDRSQEALR